MKSNNSTKTLTAALAVILIVALAFLYRHRVSQTQDLIVGTWYATSASLSQEDGTHNPLEKNDDAINLIISDKMFTVRTGTKILVDMSYIADPAQKPRTIDLKSKDGEMVGIYTVDKNRLTISLNDKTKGRPKDFDSQKNDMVLILNRVQRTSLCTIDADGSNLKQILSLPDFTFFAAAKWSPDGNKIAFEAWRPVMGEGFDDPHHILVVNADGSSVKDLGFGAMSSWSPDGKKLAYSSHGKQDSQYGIGIMNADGTGRELITPNGWSAQWSPKNNEIAYTSDNDNPELVVYNMTEKQHRTLPIEHSYSRIYPGFIWSPDGKWICFKGKLADGGLEIAAVSTEEGKKNFKVILARTAQSKISKINWILG